MYSTEYDVKTTVRVLAQVSEGIFKDEIIRFTITPILTLKDYGTFDPEGWEFDIETSELYNNKFYTNLLLSNVELIRATEIIKLKEPKEIPLKKIFSLTVTEIDTTFQEETK